MKWSVRSMAVLAVLALETDIVAAPTPLDVRHVRLALPGAPASLLPVDLDRDGRLDLVAIVAYTDVDSVIEDRIEEMVSVTTVIPALFDRREAHAFLARGEGYVAVGTPLELPTGVHVVAVGPGDPPLVALTDDGVSSLRLDPAGSRLLLEPLVAEPPVFAGSRAFLTWLDWVHDLDGDGRVDLLIPAETGLAVYLARESGFAEAPAQRLPVPNDERGRGPRAWRRMPLPEVLDLDGDGATDLLFMDRSETGAVHVLRGNGDGTFRPLHEAGSCLEERSLLRTQSAAAAPFEPEAIVFVGDLDGDRRAEVVTRKEIESGKDGMFASMKQAKRPRQRFRLYHLDDTLSVPAEPYAEFVAVGHAADLDALGPGSAGQFRDLDGDGRLELITVTLDFSMFQALRVMTTQRLTIGLEFHVFSQDDAGGFREASGGRLDEKLKLKLDDFSIARLAHFAGDFDGDGRIDFVRLGRGRIVPIHAGRAGSSYPSEPDRVLELAEEPQDVLLARIADLDGDGRSDLALGRVLPVERQDVTAPVALDIYLTREDGR